MKDFYYKQIQIFIERFSHYIESTNEREILLSERIKYLLVGVMKDLINHNEYQIKQAFKDINADLIALGL